MRWCALECIVVSLLAITINFDQFVEYCGASLCNAAHSRHRFTCSFRAPVLPLSNLTNFAKDIPIPTRNERSDRVLLYFHSSMKMSLRYLRSFLSCFFFSLLKFSLTNAKCANKMRISHSSRRLIIFYYMWKCWMRRTMRMRNMDSRLFNPAWTRAVCL